MLLAGVVYCRRKEERERETRGEFRSGIPQENNPKKKKKREQEVCEREKRDAEARGRGQRAETLNSVAEETKLRLLFSALLCVPDNLAGGVSCSLCSTNCSRSRTMRG